MIEQVPVVPHIPPRYLTPCPGFVVKSKADVPTLNKQYQKAAEMDCAAKNCANRKLRYVSATLAAAKRKLANTK